MLNIHFIAIGGGVMHTLALALQQRGDTITGSDDEIFEPSRSRLMQTGLLPEQLGWFPEKITPDLHAVILGMHAKLDNPELLKAQALGLPIYSYPEFIYQIAQHKKRIVVAGSHGKTTTTAMIIHVLNYYHLDFDYVIGATPNGFTTNVHISENAPFMIIEGDEYTTSPTDLTPKFLHYHHHIGIITGIAWDHINVYPDENTYIQQFEKFISQTPQGGVLIFNQDDKKLRQLVESKDYHIQFKPYQVHESSIENGTTYLVNQNQKIPVQFFGEHNLSNVQAAKMACLAIGITETIFYEAISSFSGTSKRLELIHTYGKTHIYRDFAHAPSKLVATLKAVKQQFPTQKLVAVFELHTYSSLNKAFLAHYANTMSEADKAIVYYNPHTLTLKRLDAIAPDEIRTAFNQPDLQVFTESDALKNYLASYTWGEDNLLLMSSGNFDNLNFKEIMPN